MRFKMTGTISKLFMTLLVLWCEQVHANQSQAPQESPHSKEDSDTIRTADGHRASSAFSYLEHSGGRWLHCQRVAFSDPTAAAAQTPSSSASWLHDWRRVFDLLHKLLRCRCL
jgi:hypothetical protein